MLPTVTAVVGRAWRQAITDDGHKQTHHVYGKSICRPAGVSYRYRMGPHAGGGAWSWHLRFYRGFAAVLLQSGNASVGQTAGLLGGSGSVHCIGVAQPRRRQTETGNGECRRGEDRKRKRQDSPALERDRTSEPLGARGSLLGICLASSRPARRPERSWL